MFTKKFVQSKIWKIKLSVLNMLTENFIRPMVDLFVTGEKVPKFFADLAV